MNSIITSIRNGKPLASIDPIFEEFEGKQVIVTVERFSGRKTLAQLGYYFGGICEQAGKFFGYTKEEMHEILMEKCARYQKVNRRTGEIMWATHRLSAMGKYDVAMTIDAAIRELSAMGFPVETPEEYFAKRGIQIGTEE